ncbi:Uma2 family endonuclease [Laspinema sp. D1]|uniref:Uma2 family endonuclease n=1 Tax=Laspinema palackyanum D2a TaxID=2953684 RepID=A0ABT2MZL3_9CYAN|nr:Uma2 family endonuclease [Laspinema sp. D2a]
MIVIPHHISPDDYLALDRQNLIRHEYRQGLVYAMNGCSDRHSRIAINLLSEVDRHLGDSPSRFYGSTVKVNYKNEFYYYPDAFVTCDPRVGDSLAEQPRQDRYIKRYPKFIAEVLSSSTEAFDRDLKFTDYQNLDSLEEYVLISQDSQRVECRRRIAADTWETTIYEAGDRITLTSLDLEFPIDRLYRGLD